MIKILTDPGLAGQTKAEYCFRHIFNILGYGFEFIDDLTAVGENDLPVFYGEQINPPLIRFGVSIFSDRECLLKLTELKLLKTGLFKTKYIKHRFEKDSKVTMITYDVIGIIFYFLSRQEEYETHIRAGYARFEHEQSVAFDLGLIDYPVVDALIKLLAEIIDRLLGQAGIVLSRVPLWPEGKRFAVCLTHDVDHIKAKSWLRVFWWNIQLLKNLVGFNTSQAKHYVTKMKRLLQAGEDPHWNFEKWMQMEGRYNYQSTFYFMSLERTLSREGRRYTLKSPRIQQIMRRMERQGWEIGLHGACHSFLDIKEMEREKRRIDKIIGKEVTGIRHHYLQMKIPQSWRNHQEIGFKYDTTLGWAGAFGFRAGTCFPFYPYDVERDETVNLLEIPLTMMDTVIGKVGRPGWSMEETMEKGEYFLQIGREFGGVITFSWHQESLDEEDYACWGKIYQRLMEKLWEAPDVFVGSAKQIQRWWQQRSASIDVA